MVLKLPQYFLQRARKLAHAPTSTAPTPTPTPTLITRPLHHHALSFEASRLDGLSSPDACPLSLPPPSRHVLVVSVVGRRGQRHRRIHRRRAGGGGRSHPSSSSSIATTMLLQIFLAVQVFLGSSLKHLQWLMPRVLWRIVS